MSRILVVEDSDRLGVLIVKALGSRGYTIDHVARADEAEAALAVARFDAVILDLGLPDRDGMTLLAPLRSLANGPAVLVLTARDDSSSVIQALDGGADDYLCKPFVMGVLLARIRALLRRPSEIDPELLVLGNLELDTQKFQFRVAGSDVVLTRREFAAVEYFMRRASRVVSKDELQGVVYGLSADVSINAVEVLVHRLRRKLEASGAGLKIHNLRGIGYMLAGEE